MEVRTWTDAQDRKVEAVLMKADEVSVVLKLKNGKEVSFPLEKLSIADRKYVEENSAFLADTKEVIADDKARETPEPEKIRELSTSMHHGQNG